MISAYAQNGSQHYAASQPVTMPTNGCGAQSLRRQHHHYMTPPQGT